jgi:signal transduction histidine kinase
MLRPVQDIQAGVQLMGGGQLSHRIEVRRDDDLGELTGSINTMAGEIQDMLDAKRQLLLAISHELRSPLTRARVSVELLEPSSLRERLDDDLREMQALISDLLESERLNNRHAVLQKNATDIVALAKDVIEKNFSGQVTLNSTAWVGDVDVDAARVQLLLRNLIGNAVRHGGAASRQPVVDIDRDGENLRLTVTDFGPGIPAEDLKNITEPFYRVDTDRSRETGGFGLGLYLCRLIAQAHAGDLAIDSEPDRRTSVTARLRVTNEETSHA